MLKEITANWLCYTCSSTPINGHQPPWFWSVSIWGSHNHFDSSATTILIPHHWWLGLLTLRGATCKLFKESGGEGGSSIFCMEFVHALQVNSFESSLSSSLWSPTVALLETVVWGHHNDFFLKQIWPKVIRIKGNSTARIFQLHSLEHNFIFKWVWLKTGLVY